MPRTPIDLPARINEIVTHVEALPEEAASPFAHYNRSANDLWTLITYFDRKLRETTFYRTVAVRHLNRLHSMVLVSLVESFERFVKEMAAVCIDHLADCILDDRLNIFTVKGTSLAAHFQSDTVGKSLRESDTWLDCDEINKRFRRILASPFADGTFYLFPKAGGQSPQSEQFRYIPLTTIFQLRHTIVHNVGVITQSDAAKLKLLTKQNVASPRVLTPVRDDLQYLKRFLDETAEKVNERVRDRLVELLDELLAGDPNLFDPQTKADAVSRHFGSSVTIAGAPGVLPVT